ncbi:(Fe-S)-binding protein [Sinomonas terrae]|uniref:(Fe-S)-binding protein n=1 Tax=Sinomonas terrae TaxID=2908838 RepID=A0ABS9U6R2_9MICC|nr:(Fe-S)-binding protein [Sinomonas terrae]MCH6472379.1 (Fe-S)-binding protein [Sinomonas terrae]
MSAQVLEGLHDASRGGALPIVCDAASCTEGLLNMQRQARENEPYRALRFVDSVDFVHRSVLPHLPVSGLLGSLALHPTCSSTQLGTNPALAEIAHAVSKEVFIPAEWGCCAFAGDRGLFHPELTDSATSGQAQEIRDGPFDAYASTNRTCELGMTKATGHPYRHVLEILEEATAPADETVSRTTS